MRISDYVLHLYLVTYFFPRYHGNIRHAVVNAAVASDKKSGLDAWINMNFDGARLFTVENEVVVRRETTHNSGKLSSNAHVISHLRVRILFQQTNPFSHSYFLFIFGRGKWKVTLFTQILVSSIFVYYTHLLLRFTLIYLRKDFFTKNHTRCNDY